MGSIYDSAAALFRSLQDKICDALEAVDGGRFRADDWDRPGGGGGQSRVLTDGGVFEKAGVNWSGVEGELPSDFAKQIPGEGLGFRATGVSLVLHPRSPMVPTTHANFRFLEKGDRCWFGGGADLTPYYFYREDAVHFHQMLADACALHPGVGDYPRFKTWCDQYFYLPHRSEPRGIGGIFFDYIDGAAAEGADADLEGVMAFISDCGQAFLDAYIPIVSRRKDEAYGARERTWQLQRRGRYVEFNLVYDRGTTFGLKTDGRTESILMSLPPLVRWDYAVLPDEGSRESELMENLVVTDWLRAHKN